MFEIRRYTPEQADEWNQFVAQSKNGTFLLDRRYMDYHADRFQDESLMVYRKDRLYALLPANINGDTLYSHQGLTYGGLVMSSHTTAAETTEVFQLLNKHLRDKAIRRVVYKAIPSIYHQLPAGEDLYALFSVCKARLVVRELSTTIVLPRHLRWSRIRRRGIKRAEEAGVVVARSTDFEPFWQVLDDNLMANHQVHPVHTVEEMRLLHSRFPDNIILYTASLQGKVIGGVVMYVTPPQVVHAQYSSATPEGKRLGVLDAIYDRIMHYDMKDYPYFDFGKSTEDKGRYLNKQLIFQKEGFGGRGICYDTYEWEL